MNDAFKPNTMHESINALQNNFSDLGINKDLQVVSNYNLSLQRVLGNKDARSNYIK